MARSHWVSRTAAAKARRATALSPALLSWSPFRRPRPWQPPSLSRFLACCTGYRHGHPGAVIVTRAATAYRPSRREGASGRRAQVIITIRSKAQDSATVRIGPYSDRHQRVSVHSSSMDQQPSRGRQRDSTVGQSAGQYSALPVRKRPGVTPGSADSRRLTNALRSSGPAARRASPAARNVYRFPSDRTASSTPGRCKTHPGPWD